MRSRVSTLYEYLLTSMPDIDLEWFITAFTSSRTYAHLGSKDLKDLNSVGILTEFCKNELSLRQQFLKSVGFQQHWQLGEPDWVSGFYDYAIDLSKLPGKDVVAKLPVRELRCMYTETYASIYKQYFENK